MSKYQPLAHFLKEFPGDCWDASFGDLERVLGFPLPPSAHEYRAWWANQFKGHHSQAKGWIDAGWVTREIDLPRRKVRFERSSGAGRAEKTSDLAELWRRAQELSGIESREELERAALTTFIRRTAIERLIAAGGSMPNFEAAPRERPFT